MWPDQEENYAQTLCLSTPDQKVLAGLTHATRILGLATEKEVANLEMHKLKPERHMPSATAETRLRALRQKKHPLICA